MPYARRDQHGKIISLHQQPTPEAGEAVSSGDPEVLDFLETGDEPKISRQFLDTTDTELVRVIEDLIELLVDKNLLLFTELPEAAQHKLINRRRARDSIAGEGPLMVDRDDIL